MIMNSLNYFPCKKSITVFLKNILLCLFISGLMIPLLGQSGDKEEDKLDKAYWVNKSKHFAKDPMGLKAEIDAYKVEIENFKAKNKSLEGEAFFNHVELDSLKNTVRKMREELSQIEAENEELRNVLKTQNIVERAGAKSGLIYRIVLIDSGDEIAYTAFGEFRKEENANNYLDYLKKLGLKSNADIRPFIDGQPVSPEKAKSFMDMVGN